MSEQNEIAAKHVAAMMIEAEEKDVPSDVIGRALLNEVIEIYKRSRSNDDISSELQFVAENLDPDTDFAFMRP